MVRRLPAAAIGLVSIALLIAATTRLAVATDGSCEAHIAQWMAPNSGEILRSDEVFTRLAKTRILLLGESHTTMSHHRWQHYMLAALHSRKPNMMVGFEMLPRRAQAVLDDWSRGTLTATEFLEKSNWREVWGYDPEFYLPLLHFARLHRLPTIALNVDRSLVAKVGQQGWQALAEEQRLGLSDPAPASDAYRDSLAALYAYKLKQVREYKSATDDSAVMEIEAIKRSDAFANFVAAQLTWDRAMAEALAAAHRRDPTALVVGIVGRGHLEFGYGIPHQLADMGIDDVDVLLPLNAADVCDPLPLDLATAVFVVENDADDRVTARPRLGVVIETATEAVRVMQVLDNSVAADSGIREGDLIQRAAGFDTHSSAALIEIIERQAPGTWLPLQIVRDGKTRKMTAKFPQQFE